MLVQAAVSLGPVKELFCEPNGNMHRALDGPMGCRSQCIVLPNGSQRQDAHHDGVKDCALLVGVNICALVGEAARSLERRPAYCQSNVICELLWHRHIP